jgi:hypothetical protein
MWNFEYNSQTGQLQIQDDVFGFSLSLYFEDGMSCEVIADNPVAFFFSKRKDETNQVKTVLAINIQTYEMDISIRDKEQYQKINLSVPLETAKSLFNMASIYQYQKTVPDFSYKRVV